MITERVFDYLDGPVIRVAGLDIPIPYEKSLERAAVPSAEAIVEAALSIC